MIFSKGATSKSVDVTIVDDKGIAVTGLVAATFPTLVFSLAGANADVTLSPVNLASLTTAWVSGGVFERGQGVYRLDLPNSCLITSGQGTVRGEETDKHLLLEKITIGPIASNIVQVNNTDVDGEGTSSNPWGPTGD